MYILQCLVWMAPYLQGLFKLLALGRVQSCVRPVGAVLMTAGLDGFRGLSPTLLCGLFMSWTLVGFLQSPA